MTAFRDGQVTLRANRRTDGFTEADKEIGYQGIRRGDLVIHSMDAFAGAIGVSDSDGKSTPVYSAVQVSPQHNAHYFAYLLRNLALTGYIEALAKGIRERSTDFRWANARTVAVPIPPKPVQVRIVDYLDRETAEIDAFIADQEKLIELLTERRVALITSTLTGGVEGSGSLQDLPVSWQLNRFSRVVKLNEGQVDPRSDAYKDLPLIAPNHIQSKTGHLLYLETAQEQAAISGKYLVRPGQVLYSKIRPALVKAVIAPTRCLSSADMYAFSTRSSAVLRNGFLYWLLLSKPFTDYAIDQSARVAMPKLNQNTLGAAPVWYPSVREQARIERVLEASTSRLDATIADAREAIALSKERRAALISAAVTGKIDVRQHGKVNA
ncbi:restriction endonuclease subunit S [Pseudoclavibacter sp. RFBA6]|uniref:restriction endonuclease subunit S n=1 Tax=Pseudoclavibacter sp. RFBA6 TaxID=2080573 RepID=UPI0015E1FE86|nr:restriction endonuclease subunit S [Pseudoclavibacter sp. RFBA6]